MTPPRVRTHEAADFALDTLLAAKGDTTVSVCIPARNEEATVGAIVATLRTELVEGLGLVDEIIVIDDHSTDDTAEVAADAGARVVAAADVLHRARRRPRQGRGTVEVAVRIDR